MKGAELARAEALHEPTREEAPRTSAVIADARLLAAQRRAAIVTIGAPTVVTAGAVVALPWYDIEPSVIGGWIALHMLTMIGITSGFHRLAAHHSFKASRPAKWLLLVLGSMTAQGPIVHWVSNHRRHHEFSDSASDVHSPHYSNGRGVGRWKGFWHSHLGWMFSASVTNPNRYARDLLRDPDVKLINRYYPHIVVLGILLPGIMVGLVTGTAAGVAQGIVWVGFVRIFTVHHATWSINSITHLFGARPWQTSEESRNCWWLAIPTAGEAWHNGHHAFPTSARFGLLRGQVDVGYLAILLFQAIGQASGVRVPSAEAMQTKMRS